MLPAVKTSVRGFTIVEAIATILVLSIALLAMTQTMSFAFTHQSDGLWQARSIALADAYLEEIDARRFDENVPIGGIPACSAGGNPCSSLGPDAGETRTLFDDVDDYHGLDEQPPLDATASAYAGYSNYRVQVTVRYLTLTEVTTLALDDVTDAKYIRVSVTPPGRPALLFTLLRGNF